MSIVYKCRHCGHVIGEINQHTVYTANLGLNALSGKEKKEMIQYQSSGDIHIQIICESCEDSLMQHPEYHELDFFIQ